MARTVDERYLGLVRGIRRTASVLLPAIVLGILLAAPAAHASLIYQVNSTGDLPDVAPGDNQCDARPAIAGDQCTLRAVIQEANGEPGTDGVDFAIPGRGVKTITPKTALP